MDLSQSGIVQPQVFSTAMAKNSNRDFLCILKKFRGQQAELMQRIAGESDRGRPTDSVSHWALPSSAVNSVLRFFPSVTLAIFLNLFYPFSFSYSHSDRPLCLRKASFMSFVA